jgi:CheY-like chemotaxis protein
MSPETVTSQSGSSKAMTIVMIEDDEGHARLIEKNIRRTGVDNNLVAFTTGAEGVSYLLAAAEPTPSTPAASMLLLLDLNLPDMSGIDILARLKQGERTRRIPVVILTTTDDRDEIARCYELGCNIYVTKPVAYDAFSQAIRQLALFFSIMKIPDMSW